MSEKENTNIPSSLLKQKLYEVLNSSFPQEAVHFQKAEQSESTPVVEKSDTEKPEVLTRKEHQAEPVLNDEALMPPITPAEVAVTLASEEVQLTKTEKISPSTQWTSMEAHEKKASFDVTLSMRGVVPDEKPEVPHLAGVPSSSSQKNYVQSNSSNLGGRMADLSGYKDLSKAPISFGDEDMHISPMPSEISYERTQQFTAAQHFVQESASQEVDTEFSGNVKTLIRLVNELPEGVTKQTGAQIIRLTMEAMGISMEDVLSEAQSAQSEMLDAVRANIKKIEEYKTVIRKLETDIKYYQGKANELSEIIDLFILSNTSGNKMSMPEDMGH